MNFEEAWLICDQIPGWFTKQDAKELWELSLDKEEVVEIGSFLGRSATLLTCIDSVKSVICIDPWIAGQRLKECIANKVPTSLYVKNFFELFLHFTNKGPFHEKITTIKYMDSEACVGWNKKIELIHLDHLHTEKCVSNSLMIWRKHLLPKAKIMIHDSNIPDVMRGIKNSGITIHKIIKDSEFAPAICSWTQVHI